MIDQVDNELRQWVDSILTAGSASIVAPSSSNAGCGISLYPLDLTYVPPQRETKRSWLELSIRYLVTAWAEQPEQAHRMLGEVLYAAALHSEFKVEQDHVPIEVWRAFNIEPRLSFFLRVVLKRPMPEAKAPLVRRPIVIEASPSASIVGVVVGPENIPLSGALVEVPALNLSTSTDRNGRFRFPLVPAAPRPKLRVRAKGEELFFDTADLSQLDVPVTIRFDKMED